MENTYEYQIAFSFANENREYVEKVAMFLKKQNITLFYDYYEEENLWGKNLVAYLEEVYTYKSKYCVIFISQFYAQKQWTCYESTAALILMLENNVKQKEYLLPVRFDDTIVPGIPKSIGFIDGNKKTPEELGALIIKKLNENKESADIQVTIEVFRNCLVKEITTGFPYYWNIILNESAQKIEVHYSFSNFEYFIKIILENNKNILLINGEYTAAFFETNPFPPSAKIYLNIKDNIITGARIMNFDFFDYINSNVFSPFEIIAQIKKEILKRENTNEIS